MLIGSNFRPLLHCKINILQTSKLSLWCAGIYSAGAALSPFYAMFSTAEQTFLWKVTLPSYDNSLPDRLPIQVHQSTNNLAYSRPAKMVAIGSGSAIGGKRSSSLL